MIFIVGDKTSASSSVASELMARAIDVTHEDFLAHVRWVNLFDFDSEGLPPALEALAHPGDAIILLGRDVAKAWLLDDLQPLAGILRGDSGPLLILVPYPSGHNRWYDDLENVAAADLALKTIWRERR